MKLNELDEIWFLELWVEASSTPYILFGIHLNIILSYYGEQCQWLENKTISIESIGCQYIVQYYKYTSWGIGVSRENTREKSEYF